MTGLVRTSWRFRFLLAHFQNDLAMMPYDVLLVAPGFGAFGKSRVPFRGR